MPKLIDSAPFTDSPRGRRRRPRHASVEQHYIPLRKTDLKNLILADPILTAQQRGQFEQLFRLLEAALHHEYHELLENLKDRYAPFNPDSDTLPSQALSPENREQSAGEFFQCFIDLLDRANYQHLLHEHVTEALDKASELGINLDVDFNVFQRLEIFARGQKVMSKPLPWAWHRWMQKSVEVPVYQRLILLFRLRQHKRLQPPVNSETIYIKIFKDIPKSDLDMLLPGTRVRMSIYDRSKIILPTVSGVALSLQKIIAGFTVAALGSVYSVLVLLGLVGGTLGYGIRSFFSYLNTKDKYQLSLTRSLYFQNLDSNAGVIFRLLDDAEEQEFREAILAYFLLWKNAGREGWTLEQLDRAAEEFLHDATGMPVDFEISDALDKLVAMKLVVPAAGCTWKVRELKEALTNLDAAWDAIYHAQPRPTACAETSPPHFVTSGKLEVPVDSDDWGPVL